MRNVYSILFCVGLLIAGEALARAHAFLDHADPKVGSVVQVSPGQIKIWFTEKLEPAFSKVQVFNAAGQEVDKHDAKVDPANRSLLTVSVINLPPGVYKVAWKVVAVDTHHTSGTFTFTVAHP